jgi:tRNA (guanine-N7-)-methyltransferase
MPGPPNKRQKRDDYRKAQENLKLKRTAQGGNQGENGSVVLPQKKFYRQRAHANPFSDHMLE